MHVPSPLSPITKIRHALWGVPPSDPKEAKLLFKIDCFVLSYVCLNYWVNYLDRSNFANAYVSGLKEDLHMVGYEYNTVNTVFTVGYAVGMIPNNIMVLKWKYWLPFCSACWALLVLGMYKCTSYKQLCAIRFFQALFESSTFSGTHLILGSWYKESELTKRSAVFTSSGLIGSIFSGFMQSSIHTSLDGRNGLAGWQWLFIIDFIITIPICIYGFVCFPDVPNRINEVFFNAEEKKIAMERLPKREHTKFDFSVIKRVVGRWHWWLFSLLWAVGGENESFCINSLFSLWLKNSGYSISQRNNYPLSMYAVGIASTFFTSLYVDLTGAKYHWHVAIWIFATLLISTILMLAKPFSDSYVFASQILAGTSYSGQATYFAWCNVVCYDDLQERAVILASMNMFSSAVNAWWSLIFYKATDVPKWRKGCYAMLATICASLVIASVLRFLQLRDEKNKAEKISEVLVYDDESLDPKVIAENPSSTDEKIQFGIEVNSPKSSSEKEQQR